MKHLLIFTISIFLISSCSPPKEPIDPSGLIDTWKLIQIYSDPGDGSGNFEDVDSDKTIEFLSNGFVVTTGTFCSLDIGSNGIEEASYDDNVMQITAECGGQDLVITYRLNDNEDELELSYPCIEGCAAKYIRM